MKLAQRLTALCLVALAAQSALADQPISVNPADVIERSRHLYDTIQTHAFRMPEQTKQTLMFELARLQRIAIGQIPPGPGPIPPGPGPGPIPPFPPGPGPGPGPIPPGPFPPGPIARTLLEADCYVDDDTTFNYPASSTGKVRGATIDQLIGDCRAIAQAAYGARGTSGLKGMTVLQADPSGVYADCHIDDDTGMTFDQFIVGRLTAANFVEAIQACKRIAQSTFGASSSGGVKNRGFVQELNWMVTGECQLDDDPDFTPDQITFGAIRATNIQDLVRECTQISRETYGANGSSGVKNIRQPRL